MSVDEGKKKIPQIFDQDTGLPLSEKHGKRGKDKKPRSQRAKLDFAAKLKRNHGIDAQKTIAKAHAALGKIEELAAHSVNEYEESVKAGFADPELRDAAIHHLTKYTDATDKYHKTILPYVAKKLPVEKVSMEDVEVITLDDIQSMSEEDVQARLALPVEEDKDDGED